MIPNTAIGGGRTFHPQRAIVVYQDQGHSGEVFATVHKVRRGAGGVPVAEPGELLTAAFLQSLAEQLGTSLRPEILPPNVLCRTPQMVAWWTAPAWRPLFFRKGSALGAVSGMHFPIPALVWRLVGREFYVRALEVAERPDAGTQLMRAPFWNTNPRGLVCQGSMQKPESLSAATLAAWTDAYFAAEFTHVFDQFGAGDATSHPGGMEGLWKALAGDREAPREFPVEHLVPANETLQEFVQRGARDA